MNEVEQQVVIFQWQENNYCARNQQITIFNNWSPKARDYKQRGEYELVITEPEQRQLCLYVYPTSFPGLGIVFLNPFPSPVPTSNIHLETLHGSQVCLCRYTSYKTREHAGS